MTKYELYEFTLGDKKYRFTSAQRFVTDNDSNIYEPAVIGSSDIEYSEDMEKNKLKINFPTIDGFAQTQLRSRREQILYLVLKVKEGAEEQVLFRGRLDDVDPSQSEISLTFVTEYTNLNILGARKYFQRTCPYTLYGAGCNADKKLFETRTTISAINGLNITLRGTFTDGAYNLGMIKSEKTGDYIGIERNSGATFTMLNLYDLKVTTEQELADYAVLEEAMNQALLDYQASVSDYEFLADIVENMNPDDTGYAAAVAQMEAAQAVMLQKEILYQDAVTAVNNADAYFIYAYFGCNKIHTTCKDKFNNLNNFGGFPFMPSKNPSSRSLV